MEDERFIRLVEEHEEQEFFERCGKPSWTELKTLADSKRIKLGHPVEVNPRNFLPKIRKYLKKRREIAIKEAD